MIDAQLHYKPDFARAQTYWDAVWNHDIIDRPCTSITAGKTANPSKYSRIVPVDDDFSPVLRDGDAYLDSHAFLGEAMPEFRMGFGPDQMAAFLGAPLMISKGSIATSWSEKIVTDWEEFLPLNIADDNIYFNRMKEFHKAAEKHFAGRCLLSEIDMHSNVDMLEGLRGAEKLLYDMMLTPDLIATAMKQARKIFTQVHNEFSQYGSKEQYGTTSGLALYDRGKYNRIQADFIALLSPDLLRTYVIPALEEEAAFLDRSCFHLDGPDALNHLDDILAIKDIDAIQWMPGAGNKPQIEWPEVLHAIQKAGKIAYLQLSASNVKQLHGTYKPELLVYQVYTASVEEGLELLEWLTRNT